MEKRTRASRFAVTMGPAFFRGLREDQGTWYESPEEIEAALEWGFRKQRLMRMLQMEMGRTLTPRERRCVRLHFLKGMSFEHIARLTCADRASVSRSVRGSIRRLRRALKRRLDELEEGK